MKYMRQVHGSALWLEISYDALLNLLSGEDYSCELGKIVSLLLKGGKLETDKANYRAMLDGDDLDKKIESKCTEFVLRVMDEMLYCEMEAKEVLETELSLLIRERFGE